MGYCFDSSLSIGKAYPAAKYAHLFSLHLSRARPQPPIQVFIERSSSEFGDSAFHEE